MVLVSVLLQHHGGPTGDILVIKNPDGTYTFPTSKVRTTETEKDAAKRTVWEVCGLDSKVGDLVLIGHKKPNDGSSELIREGNIRHNTNTYVDYHCYYDAINRWEADPTTGIDYEWVHASQLGQLKWVGDDANFMAKYDAYVNPQFIPDVRMY